jgi:hypothetical protein
MFKNRENRKQRRMFCSKRRKDLEAREGNLRKSLDTHANNLNGLIRIITADYKIADDKNQPLLKEKYSLVLRQLLGEVATQEILDQWFPVTISTVESVKKVEAEKTKAPAPKKRAVTAQSKKRAAKRAKK